MLAMLFATLLLPHMNQPSDARILTRPLPMSWMYCFTPPPFEITMDEYPAPSAPLRPIDPNAARQISLPVVLSRATIAALAPPGVTITRSPSTSGDSENIQLDIM